MKRAEREQRAADLRTFVHDSIRREVSADRAVGDLVGLVEAYVRASQAATVALCAEGMNCSFCVGWLSGHDDHEASR